VITVLFVKNLAACRANVRQKFFDALPRNATGTVVRRLLEQGGVR
jgi:hypothetical protein